MCESYIQELDYRDTLYGLARRIKIRRFDEKPMSWRELWEAFSSMYPGWWGIQMLPPAHELMDEANIYHILILPLPFPPEFNFNHFKGDRMIKIVLDSSDTYTTCPVCSADIDLVELLGEDGIGEVNMINCPECEAELEVHID